MSFGWAANVASTCAVDRSPVWLWICVGGVRTRWVSASVWHAAPTRVILTDRSCAQRKPEWLHLASTRLSRPGGAPAHTHVSLWVLETLAVMQPG